MNKLFFATSANALACVIATTLALAIPAHPAQAEQIPQGIVVYYGSADFVGIADPGVTVGPFSSPAACDDALDAAIDNAVQTQNYVVESVSPCMPRWSFKGRLPAVDAAPYTFEVLADSPGESLDVARVLLKEVRAARDAYRAAEYDAVLSAIQRAAITDPLRKRDRRDTK